MLKTFPDIDTKAIRTTATLVVGRRRAPRRFSTPTAALPRGVWVTIAPGIKVMRVPLWTDWL